jgi:8-amino-7-oxononanoate synthase
VTEIASKVVDAFAKARRFERAEEAHALGLYPYFKAIEHHAGGTVTVDGEEYVLTGSNDYLGLTQDPRIKEAAKIAIDSYGTSCTGSRFLTGTLDLHETLEYELADFLKKEKTLVFGAGFLACATSVAALGGRHDIIYFDRENHASLYDGARLSYGKLERFEHNDAADLERALERDADKPGGRLVYTEGVFSMSGHIGTVDEVARVAKKHGARLICDDAHATGVLGAHGEGAHVHFGIENDVDLVVGTFSKSFASVGGFIAGEADIVDFIKHTGRPFIFNAALPAPNAAATLEALRIMRSEPHHRENMWKNVNFMRDNLLTLGFDLLGSNSPIIPVLMKTDDMAIRFWKALWEEHIFTTPSVSPAVPVGMSIIRTSYNGAHKPEHLEKALHAFEKVGKALGVIS